KDLWLLWNAGGGSFPSQEGLTSDGELASLVTGDVDGDGDPDLIVAGLAKAEVLLNGGDRKFGSVQSLSIREGLGPCALADLDGDGDLDLSAANAVYSDVTLYANEQ